MPHTTTTKAARILGIHYARLLDLIRTERMTPPVRDDGGRYCWTEADIERARVAMKIDRRRKPKAAAVST